MVFELLATHRRDAIPPAFRLGGVAQIPIALQAALQSMPLADDRLVVAAQVAGLQLVIEQIDGGTCAGQSIGQTAMFTHTISHGALRQRVDGRPGGFRRFGAGGDVKVQNLVKRRITRIELIGEAQPHIGCGVEIILMCC